MKKSFILLAAAALFALAGCDLGSVEIVEPDIPVAGISLDKSSLSLAIGGVDTETLTATIEPADATNQNITWSSNVTDVATVDEDGVVTATGCGTAYITATTEDGGFTATCVVTVKIASLQLWADGPYFAKCNVGATKAYESGYYFWWGDTVGYKRNSEDNAWVSAGDGTTSIKFYQDDATSAVTWGKSSTVLQMTGYIDNSGNLVAAHDAATAHMGSPWRMPTSAEFQALADNCDWEWKTVEGVNGYSVTGKGDYADKSIFLPAAGVGNQSALKNAGEWGFYWSSTRYLIDEYGSDWMSYGLYLKQESIAATDKTHRWEGFPVRAVYSE